MKVLVTGATGQLGYDVCRTLAEQGFDFVGIGSKDCDITDADAVNDLMKKEKPDAVMHLAAYTKVDLAEDEPEKCWAINAQGTANIAFACRKIGAKMMYISTDYVFPGDGEEYYKPTDPVGPKSVYGRTKLAGELAVQSMLTDYFIVRISWVFGQNGNNFIKTMLKLAETGSEVRVVSDQVGSPTYTADLAPLLCDMIQTEKYGIYHATNEGVCSWSELAEYVFRTAGKNTKVIPVTTEEYGARAPRPKNSRLDKSSIIERTFIKLPNWKSAVYRYIYSQK